MSETTPTPTLPLKGEGVSKRQKKIGRGGKWYTPAESGDGVAFEFEKIKPEVMKRIEALGVLNDRRVAYVAAGDWMSLLQLADEYEAKKMPVMAEAVRKEAYEFKDYGRVKGRKPKGRSTARNAGAVGGATAGDVYA